MINIIKEYRLFINQTQSIELIKDKPIFSNIRNINDLLDPSRLKMAVAICTGFASVDITNVIVDYDFPNILLLTFIHNLELIKILDRLEKLTLFQ